MPILIGNWMNSTPTELFRILANAHGKSYHQIWGFHSTLKQDRSLFYNIPKGISIFMSLHKRISNLLAKIISEI